MLKKCICGLLASLFLTSSVLLPLGDFFLMNDLPGMYNRYTRITSPDEVGIVDFVGDYLLHGKDLFGHNGNDKTPLKGSDIQFQHQANPLNVVFSLPYSINLFTVRYVAEHPDFKQQFRTSGYNNELFRPPLG
jgi:hypothetical protein